MKTIFLFFLFVSINLFSFGNCYLVLRKEHKKVCAFFKKTEIVYFSHERWNNGVIDSISNDFFIVKGEKIFLSEIQHIKTVRKSLNYKSDGLMLILGGAYFATVDMINKIINNERFDMSGNTILASALLISSGLILYQMGSKSYKLGGKFTLETVCL